MQLNNPSLQQIKANPYQKTQQSRNAAIKIQALSKTSETLYMYK